MVIALWSTMYLLSSTYLTLERMEDDDGHYVSHFKKDGGPNSDDWENVNILVLFLKSFYDITLKFSSSEYMTSN